MCVCWEVGVEEAVVGEGFREVVKVVVVEEDVCREVEGGGGGLGG